MTVAPITAPRAVPSLLSPSSSRADLVPAGSQAREARR
jgi:hypothetical protein